MKKKLSTLAIIAIAGFLACSSGGGDSSRGTAMLSALLFSNSGQVRVTGASLNRSSIAISAGGTEQLTVTIAPSNATNQNVTWTSSNGSAVTVSTGGLVSRTAFGTATITVTTVDGNFTASCTVTVPIQLVSVDSSGTQGNSHSSRPSISADGRYVAFNSGASNLVPGDTNGNYDIFVYDRQTSTTQRISVDSTGAQGDNDSYDLALSTDGRYVAFSSRASNLATGDTNGFCDIFVHDRQTETTERVSVDSSGTQGDNDSFAPSISADGRYVAFYSMGANLVPGDTNGKEDVFVHDRQTHTTERVSVDSTGVQGNGHSEYPSISADGRYVAFHSEATNFMTGDTNGYRDVFLYDRQTGVIQPVSVNAGGAVGDYASSRPSISADGRYVAFWSLSKNLVTGHTNSYDDIFVWDRQTNAIQLISVGLAGAQANGWSEMPSISADGRFIAFQSTATNLVTGDTNGKEDVFIYDRQASTNQRLSIDSSGGQGNSDSTNPSISADGQYVVFISSSTNLVSVDSNGFADIFAVPVQ